MLKRLEKMIPVVLCLSLFPFSIAFSLGPETAKRKMRAGSVFIACAVYTAMNRALSIFYKSSI
ncbi:MAG: hypothetical protein EPN37_03785 [Chitinophagaceae bacterium]|jgi:hypothetical protein|nr:MAG: hypothetical protein EPN37_03785 [Chitinophagaceae bacterium]